MKTVSNETKEVLFRAGIITVIYITLLIAVGIAITKDVWIINPVLLAEQLSLPPFTGSLFLNILAIPLPGAAFLLAYGHEMMDAPRGILFGALANAAAFSLFIGFGLAFIAVIATLVVIFITAIILALLPH